MSDDGRRITPFNAFRSVAEALIATVLAIALMCMLAAIARRHHPLPNTPDLALRGSLR